MATGSFELLALESSRFQLAGCVRMLQRSSTVERHVVCIKIHHKLIEVSAEQTGLLIIPHSKS